MKQIPLYEGSYEEFLRNYIDRFSAKVGGKVLVFNAERGTPLGSATVTRIIYPDDISKPAQWFARLHSGTIVSSEMGFTATPTEKVPERVLAEDCFRKPGLSEMLFIMHMLERMRINPRWADALLHGLEQANASVLQYTSTELSRYGRIRYDVALAAIKTRIEVLKA